MKSLNFKHFFAESRLSRLSPSEETQADALIKQFREKYNSPEKIREVKNKARNSRFHIGNINVVDRETNKEESIPVYIGRGVKGALFKTHDRVLQQEKIIVLNYLKALDTSDPEEANILLKHEIRHAVQQYKQATDAYGAHLQGISGYEDDKHYYTDPHELDAQETELFYRLKHWVDKSKSLQPLVYKKLLLPRIKSSLRKFLTTEWDKYANEQEKLPPPLAVKKRLLTALHENPNLWKRFKKKIETFLEEIEQL